jgi:hypothetical protein
VKYVEFSDMMYSISMCWSACWVSWLLCWTAWCCDLRHVVLSGMHYSKLCLAVCWRSDSMMHWSASWALCCVGQLDGQYVGLIGRHD